jgi:hypothetical protein
MRIQSLLGMTTIWGIMTCVAFAADGQGTKSQVLTNADVLSMTQAELGDAVIIDKIKSSPCRFDTSPKALVTLKQAGVSQAVLDAVVHAGNTADVPQIAKGPCAILKRMGPADEVTSHLYSFGIRGKQFQFVEGRLPEGVKFHGRLTDHDVRTIEDHGGRVSILDAHYTEGELRDARTSCSEAAPTAVQ